MALDFEKAISNIKELSKDTGETSAVNEPDKKYERRCTCDWSNRDGMGFIPNVDCQVHGKEVRKQLRQSVSYGGKSKMPKFDIKKFKNWTIWIVVALFGAIIAWRLILKFT